MFHPNKQLLEEHHPLALELAEKFRSLPQVVAVTLAGSRTTMGGDEASDFDFYIYMEQEIPIEIRTQIAQEFATRFEINNQFWEPGDEWIDHRYNCGVDIMYRTTQWIEAQLDRVLVQHQASIGYSTCFWWNVLTSQILVDRAGWFQQLQAQVNQPYPQALKHAILAKNYPILRQTISSFRHQLESAVKRQDRISFLHRTTAILGSYFDILFALNSVPHPGEKRLSEWATKLCPKVPQDLPRQLENITLAFSSPANSPILLEAIDLLIDGLETLLNREGLIENGQIREKCEEV